MSFIFNRLILWIIFFPLTTAVCYAQKSDVSFAWKTESKAQIANPASVYCLKSGGTLSIRKHKDGGEYGVCVFKDNKECEEWALFRGECPIGGIDIGNFKTHDPFRYCSIIGTIDAPDARYTGKEKPDSIMKSMIKQGIISADAPPEFMGNFVWRCMHHRVWVCLYGANIPCTDKANISKEPSFEMMEYCKQNPSSDNIPAYLTGRTTVYAWGCSNGRPFILKQVHQVDHEGFIKAYWYELRQE